MRIVVGILTEENFIKTYWGQQIFISLTDSTDQLILNSLVNGKSYEVIANECYLSVGSVKYRIKRILSTVGCDSKDELVEILKKHNLN